MHGYPDGRAPGAERLEALGLEHTVFHAAGTSEDIAMLLAFERGAELIVAVGTHTSMVDFLDKGRAGMASTVPRADEGRADPRRRQRRVAGCTTPTCGPGTS